MRRIFVEPQARRLVDIDQGQALERLRAEEAMAPLAAYERQEAVARVEVDRAPAATALRGELADRQGTALLPRPYRTPRGGVRFRRLVRAASSDVTTCRLSTAPWRAGEAARAAARAPVRQWPASGATKRHVTPAVVQLRAVSPPSSGACSQTVRVQQARRSRRSPSHVHAERPRDACEARCPSAARTAAVRAARSTSLARARSRRRELSAPRPRSSTSSSARTRSLCGSRSSGSGRARGRRPRSAHRSAFRARAAVRSGRRSHGARP